MKIIADRVQIFFKANGQILFNWVGNKNDEKINDCSWTFKEHLSAKGFNEMSHEKSIVLLVKLNKFDEIYNIHEIMHAICIVFYIIYCIEQKW